MAANNTALTEFSRAERLLIITAKDKIENTGKK